jgi:glycosyltransferase involved in cell wall biosynthesis
MAERENVAVVISTKNRKDDLRLALRSAVAQRPPVEILVIDDGSSDGTTEMVRSEFPGVHVERSEESRGYVVQRNRGARSVRAPIVVSIDDDAEFSSSTVVAQAVRCFDDPQVGAVGIPFINVRSGSEVLQRAPDDRSWVLSSFTGTAYAIRRDLFVSLGGFREKFVHQGEEEDFCIRLLGSGHVVRAGMGEPVLHKESPKRSFQRMDYYGRRNLLLFAWCNVPWPFLAIHVPATIWNALRHIPRTGRYRSSLRGLLAGAVAPVVIWDERKPVTASVYRTFRWLKKSGPALESDLRRRVPLSDGESAA